MLLEAALLLCFGVLGTRLASLQGLYVSLTVVLLCFIMGLQNALITKLSGAEIRTTHLTGIETDIGIEVGRLVSSACNRERLAVRCSLAACFFLGALVGAFGFKQVGYFSTVPLAAILLLLAIVPAVDDFLSAWRRRMGRPKLDAQAQRRCGVF